MAEEKVKARCPHCGAVVHWCENPYRPFCSQRCKLIDLGKWIDEKYRLAGEKSSSEEGKEVKEKG